MKRLALLLALLFAAPAWAADPTPPAPPAPAIILPDGPPAPQPPPIPPNTPTKLAADQLYVIRAGMACNVLASPDGLVKITAETGPIKIKAHFVDSPNGSYQCRTFAEKFIYTVESAGSGSCELIIVPSDGGPIIRRTLDVGGPAPPPGPGPQPPPTPTDPLTLALQAAYAMDTDADRAASLTFLQGAYRGMARAAPGLAENKTTADWSAYMKFVVEAPAVGLPVGKADHLRKAIAAEFVSAWGAKAVPLAAADAAKEMQKVADSLSGLK